MAAALSPRNRYLAAGLAAGLGILLGGAIFGYCLFTALDKLPEPATEFPDRQATVISTNHAGEWAIYADSSEAVANRERCEVAVPDGRTLPVTRPATNVEIGRGGHHWKRIAAFKTDAAGAHTITCVSGDGVSGFAVGEPPDTSGFAIRLAVGIGSLVVLALSGILTAIILVVTGMRRAATAAA